jgi:hypothetical protein
MSPLERCLGGNGTATTEIVTCRKSRPQLVDGANSPQRPRTAAVVATGAPYSPLFANTDSANIRARVMQSAHACRTKRQIVDVCVSRDPKRHRAGGSQNGIERPWPFLQVSASELSARSRQQVSGASRRTRCCQEVFAKDLPESFANWHVRARPSFAKPRRHFGHLAPRLRSRTH